MALLHTFGRQGLLGGFWEFFDQSVAYSTAAVVIGQAFVSLPFLIVTLEQALHGLSKEVIQAAVIDGGGPTRALPLPHTVHMAGKMPGI